MGLYGLYNKGRGACLICLKIIYYYTIPGADYLYKYNVFGCYSVTVADMPEGFCQVGAPYIGKTSEKNAAFRVCIAYGIGYTITMGGGSYYACIVLYGFYYTILFIAAIGYNSN